MRDDAIAQDARVTQRELRFRQNIAPLVLRGTRQIDRDQPCVRRVRRSTHIKDVVDLRDELVLGIESVDESHDAAARHPVGPELPVVNALALRTVVQEQHEVAPVVADERIRIARRVIGHFENVLVGRDRRAEHVSIDFPLLRSVSGAVRQRGIARVVHRFRIRRPRNLCEFEKAQHLGKIPARLDIAEMPRPPVRSAVGQTVSEHATIGTRHELAERDRAIRAQRVRIQENARLAVERLGDVQHTLVLQSVVAQIEVAPAPPDRHVIALVVPKLGHPGLAPLARGNRLQEGLRQRILRLDPHPRFGARLVFEPAIRIGHANAVVHVDMIDPLRFRIGESTPARTLLGRIGGTRQHRQGRHHHQNAIHRRLLSQPLRGSRARRVFFLASARLRSHTCRLVTPCRGMHTAFVATALQLHLHTRTMRYTTFAVLLFGSLAATFVRAEPLTVERIFAAPDLSGPRLREPQFSPDGRYVTYLQGKADAKDQLDLWAFDTRTGASKLLVDSRALATGPETLSAEEEARRERQRTASLQGIVEYSFSRDGKRLLVPLGGDLYVYELDAVPAVRRLTTTDAYETDAKLSPRGRYVSFIRDQNLYVIDLRTGNETALTTDGEGLIHNGVAEFIAQEEMDRDTGYWWSPDES